MLHNLKYLFVDISLECCQVSGSSSKILDYHVYGLNDNSSGQNLVAIEDFVL